MSNIIAIWGSPFSGKTTLSVKMAQLINQKYSGSVCVVCADDVTPTLPILFPNAKSEDMHSIGTPLSKPDITENEILKNIVTIKGKSNLGFLGYMDGENKFSYPTLDKTKVTALITILSNLVDVVIVDCSSNIHNIITAMALKSSDSVIRVVNPDIKSVSFCYSQLNLMNDPSYKKDEHIVCLNSTDNMIYEPIIEATSYFKDVAFSFPYCLGLKNQMMKGTLLEKFSDKKFDGVINALVEKAVK